MNKAEFIRKAAVELLAAYIVEDRMAWYKDPSCFGNDFEMLSLMAVSGAEALWKKLEERGYVKSEQENKIPPLEEGIDPSWIDGFKGCI